MRKLKTCDTLFARSDVDELNGVACDMVLRALMVLNHNAEIAQRLAPIGCEIVGSRDRGNEHGKTSKSGRAGLPYEKKYSGKGKTNGEFLILQTILFSI